MPARENAEDADKIISIAFIGIAICRNAGSGFQGFI